MDACRTNGGGRARFKGEAEKLTVGLRFLALYQLESLKRLVRERERRTENTESFMRLAKIGFLLRRMGRAFKAA